MVKECSKEIAYNSSAKRFKQNRSLRATQTHRIQTLSNQQSKNLIRNCDYCSLSCNTKQFKSPYNIKEKWIFFSPSLLICIFKCRIAQLHQLQANSHDQLLINFSFNQCESCALNINFCNAFCILSHAFCLLRHSNRREKSITELVMDLGVFKPNDNAH